ncbi:MAG: hypothetical protein V1844_14565 [Pseudomonadota bacterium]
MQGNWCISFSFSLYTTAALPLFRVAISGHAHTDAGISFDTDIVLSYIR